MEATTIATSGMTFTDSTIGATFTSIATWSTDDLLWTLIFGFIVAFILAFAVGANDVANSFGTTVGAKVLTLKTACILASIFETLGAVLLGAKVGETIRKGIIDITIYNATEEGRELLMIGEVSAMTGAAIWQLIATCLGLPVSGTHSIVGACIGFSLVAVGATGVNWKKLGLIIGSWFISPVLSGIMAVSLYIFVSKFILAKDNPLQNGLKCLPFFYAFTFGINCFSIFYTGAPLLGLDLEVWMVVLITLGLMIIVGVVVQCVVVPRLRRKALKGMDIESLTGLSMVKRRSSDDTSPFQTPTKSQNKTDSVLNDSGYQTPNDPRKRTNIVVDQSDFPVIIGDESANDSLLQQYETEINDKDNNSSTGDKTSEADDDMTKLKLKSPSIKKSESYGDDDSAYEDPIMNKSQLKEPSIDKTDKLDEDDKEEEEDPPSVRLLFSTLQILTACFGSFAHGGNDVSNAIGPLIALWLIYHSGNVVQKAATPWYLLLYGGLGIIAGLWILGRRVIRTIGSDLTKITPSRGFCIELMTALTVLIASNIGIPVSTTHCKVGSVVSIGWFRSRSAVTWSTVRNIAIAWFVTVPVSGLISAGVMYVLLLIAT
ncbi:sodium-dependent phosphate transporter 1-A-like [Styela clava]